MTLTYFCDIDMHLRKIFKSLYLGDYYSYSNIIMHSDRARNGLRGDGICDLDLHKRGSEKP